MHDKAKKAQPTGRTFKVIQTLKRQINLLRSVQSNEDWKLTYFREAIKMEDFNVVVQTVQRFPGCGIFSTLQEIEVLEEGIRNNDTVELTVQCCVILYVFERTVGERLPDPSIDRRWPFVSCQSLEEIAYLRHRLRFVEDSSYLLEELNISLMLAVHRYVGKQISLLNWRGLLLVFREANPGCIYRLLMFLILVLQDEDDKMPAEAASLFLSYVASAIYVLSGSLGGYECPLEEKMIMKLLQLGASPMVSEEHHHVLFARLENHLQTRRWPGWMPIDAPKSEPKKRYPTALNQLLAHTWCDEVVEVLAERTCCSLDAVGAFKKNFNVERLLSLRCLASQKLRETDLEQLSGTMKFLASKHRPIKLQDFSDLR